MKMKLNLKVDNETFLSYFLPPLSQLPTPVAGENAIVHKKLLIFGDQGSGKTSLAKGIVNEAYKRYGARSVNAVRSSRGQLEKLLAYGFDNKPVQIHIADDFTLDETPRAILKQYFKCRHIWRAQLGAKHGYILSIFNIHRFHSSSKEIRSSANGVLAKSLSLNPYDVSFLKRLLGSDGVEDLKVIEEASETSPKAKGFSVYYIRTGRKGILFLPLASLSVPDIVSVRDKLTPEERYRRWKISLQV